MSLCALICSPPMQSPPHHPPSLPSTLSLHPHTSTLTLTPLHPHSPTLTPPPSLLHSHSPTLTPLPSLLHPPSSTLTPPPSLPYPPHLWMFLVSSLCSCLSRQPRSPSNSCGATSRSCSIGTLTRSLRA